jgi:nitrite reductase/ring-hydroxylating ferredoxin subunit
MPPKTLKRSFWQRILGRCVTQVPGNADCWSFENGTLMLDLDQAPELAQPGTALRLEGKDLPKRVLVVHGDDGEYHAFCNQCGHGGRRLDPVPETSTVQCCSVGKSTYTYDGKLILGPAKRELKPFETRRNNNVLSIVVPD